MLGVSAALMEATNKFGLTYSTRGIGKAALSVESSTC